MPAVSERTEVEKITLPVEGMTCAACQANVQRALNATPGVERAAVNLMTHEATVSYDPALASPQALVDAVNATGYVSRLPDAGDRRRRRRRQRRSGPTPPSIAICCARSLVSLALGVARDDRVDAADGRRGRAPPLARSAHRLDDAGRSIRRCGRAARGSTRSTPDVLRYGLLAITVFVMVWAGRHFYTRAWAAFRHRTADMNTLIAVGTGAAFRVFRSPPRSRPGCCRTAARARTSTTKRSSSSSR